MKSLRNSIALLIIAMATTISFAQDGEGLFKAKCNVCHMLGKDGTGPNLKGVKQKWEDAGETDFLYRWVKNPEELIASGESKQAAAIKDFSPTMMTPQEVTNEEIDAIFAYVDAYEPPADNASSAVADPAAGPVVVIVPNYKKNLKLFYFLIFALFVQILAIILLANSTRSLVSLQDYKIKKGASNTFKTILILVGVFTSIVFNNSSLAIDFVAPGGTLETGPWLLVEDADIYFLIAANIGMLLLVFHFRRLFLDIATMIRPQTVTEKVSKRKQRKMNQILTDAVPISEEHSILMHHEYDGIKELDNNLPPWWVWGFYATIVFAVVYIFNYHILKTGDLQIAEYDKSIATAQAEVNAYLDKMAMNVDETNATLMTEDADLSTGKVVFEANCISCHNNNGGGNQIGPNLTDKNWIYGFDIKDVFFTVKNGRPNGMPEHNSKLNPIQIQQVASYVLSLPPAEGREPQGDFIEE